MIRTCVNYECKVMSAGDAKALNAESIQAVFAMKGDAELTKALSPSVDTLSESMKGLDAQKAVSWFSLSFKQFLHLLHMSGGSIYNIHAINILSY